MRMGERILVFWIKMSWRVREVTRKSWETVTYGWDDAGAEKDVLGKFPLSTTFHTTKCKALKISKLLSRNCRLRKKRCSSRFSEERRSAQIQIGSIESREKFVLFSEKFVETCRPSGNIYLTLLSAGKKLMPMDRYMHTGERTDNAFYLPTRNFTITQIGFHCFFIWRCACESRQTICCRNGTERKEINMPQSTSRVRNKLSWWLLCHHLHCAQFHFGKQTSGWQKKIVLNL